jgi:hypothetical protein
MRPLPLWIRIPVFLLCGASIAYAAYHLYLQAVGSETGAVIVAVALGAWLAVYLIFGRRLAALLRGTGPKNSN